MNQTLKKANPLTQEMRQTADALRHSYEQMKFLLRTQHPVSGYQETWRILADAPGVADALDVIAGRLEPK
jgi:hypothetical protein